MRIAKTNRNAESPARPRAGRSWVLAALISFSLFAAGCASSSPAILESGEAAAVPTEEHTDSADLQDAATAPDEDDAGEIGQEVAASTPEPTTTPLPTVTPAPSPTPLPSPTPEPSPTPVPEVLTAAEQAFVDEITSPDLPSAEKTVLDGYPGGAEAFVSIAREICATDLADPMSTDFGLQNQSRYESASEQAIITLMIRGARKMCPDDLINPLRFEGVGDYVLVLDEVFDGLALVYMQHDGSSNFQVTLLDSTGERIGSLANEIGTYQGFTITSDDDAALMQVTADGSWVVELMHVRNAADYDGNGPITGSGDEILHTEFEDTAAPLIARFSCPNCESNVFVRTYGTGRSIVNEIGSYEGTVVIPGDNSVLEIVTWGRNGGPTWTLTPIDQ